MNITQIMGWMQVAQVAIPLGLATVEQIKGWIRGSNQTMTDAEMNVALGIILDDAQRRRLMAIADATGQPT